MERQMAKFWAGIRTGLSAIAKHRGGLLAVLGVLVLVIAASAEMTFTHAHTPHFTAQTDDWTAYMGGNAHTGYNGAETVINQTSAPSLQRIWQFPEHHQLFTQPVVANGLIYWGSFGGNEYASDANGNVIWQTDLGRVLSTCTNKSMGVTSTATAVTETINGTPTPVLYVGGGNAQMYKLNAMTGAVLWQTPLGSPTDTFIWDSPAIYNGSVYIGIAGFGDCPPPKVQGQLFKLDTATGQIQGDFKIVPDGCTGAGVWGSITVDEATGILYFGTANAGTCATFENLNEAIIALNAADLSFIGSWQIKQQKALDIDFGTTPTLFTATINGVQRNLIGMADKNGNYYAWDRSHVNTGPLWHAHVANGGSSPTTGTISSSAWDGTYIYAGGGKTTINGVVCPGSLNALNPANGAFVFRTCLTSGPVLGAVMAVPGLAVVGANNTLDVIATTGASAGQIIYSYQETASTSYFKGAATIADGVLYAEDWNGHLDAFAPPATPPTPTPTA